MRAPAFSRLVAIVSFALLASLGTGCSTSSQEAYNNQVEAADTAYKAGKITTAEYLKLKQDAQNAYLSRSQQIQNQM
jgi:hypothetical protein